MEEVEIVEEKEMEIWLPKAKTPVSMLKCPICWIRDSCPLFKADQETCPLEELETIETTTGEGLISIIQTILAIQARRILRLSRWEELSGGLPDPGVTAEMKSFLFLVEAFKKIISEEDSLLIKIKGKGTAGVISQLFGG